MPSSICGAGYQSCREVSACWSGAALAVVAGVLALPAGRHRADTATKPDHSGDTGMASILSEIRPCSSVNATPHLQVAFLFLAGLAVLVFANGGNDLQCG